MSVPDVGECPTTGMTCVLTVLADMQAVIDQLVGMSESVRENADTALERHVAEKTLVVARYLQNSKDRYEEKHGATDASFLVRAARALRQVLAG